MYGKYHIVRGDLFGITRRLKEIDKGYFVVYAYKKKRFEVHHRGQAGGSFCLAVPFDRLDARLIAHVLRSRVQNADKVFAAIERDNKILFKQERYEAVKKAENRTEELLSAAR